MVERGKPRTGRIKARSDVSDMTRKGKAGLEVASGGRPRPLVLYPVLSYHRALLSALSYPSALRDAGTETDHNGPGSLLSAVILKTLMKNRHMLIPTEPIGGNQGPNPISHFPLADSISPAVQEFLSY